MSTETIENPLQRLSDEQLEQLAKEFDAIHDEVYDDLGADDANYIRSVIEFHRRLLVLSRIVLMASRYKPAWLLGPPASRWRRSSRTWRSATTSCTASGTG